MARDGLALGFWIVFWGLVAVGVFAIVSGFLNLAGVV